MAETNNNFKVTAKLILYSLPLIGILGILFPSIIGKFNLVILSSYLAIPLIVAPIIYMKYNGNKINSIELNDKLLSLFLSIYFICISLSIIILYKYDIRPISYYIVITLMSLMILLEILLFKDSKRKTRIVLAQLMIFVLCILWSVNLKYFYYISRTDPIFHITAIESLINNAYIIEEVFGQYKPFPLWHILCTFVHHISALNLPTQKTMYLTNGLIYSFIPVITYIVSNKIFKNNKISLISALFVTINPDVISYGMSSISRSVVSFLFLLLIYCLSYGSNLKMILVSIILIFPIIIYHPASTPFILSILILISVGEYLYNESENKKFITYNYIAMFILINLFYWIYYAELIFEMMIQNIIRESPSGVITGSIIFTPLNELFNYIQYALLLFFIIIGILRGLNSDEIPTIGRIFCTVGLISVILVFPGPSLLINKLAADLNIGRFGQYFYPFISLTAALGFVTMYNRTKKYSKIIIILVFISLTFLSVSNDFVASDNPIVKRPFYTYYLTEQEINSFNTISAFTSGYTMSDYVTIRYISKTNTPYSDKTHILEVDSVNMHLLKEKDEDVFIIRNSELSKRPLKLYTNTKGVFKLNPTWESGTKLDYYYNDLKLWENLGSYNKIYDTKNIEALI